METQEVLLKLAEMQDRQAKQLGTVIDIQEQLLDCVRKLTDQVFKLEQQQQAERAA